MKRYIRIYALICITLTNIIVYAQDTTFTQKQLIQDARDLISIIETVHPDPYVNGGGKIEFHRKFQSVLHAIPDSGMTLEEYVWLLQPFVNSVGDGHTTVNNPFFRYDPKAVQGIPFWFSIFSEKGLYISKVATKEFESLIGSRLISVDGLSIRELMQKTRKLLPCQNDYDVLWNLNGMLWEKYFLERLLPERIDKNSLNVEIELINSERKNIKLDLTEKRVYPLIKRSGAKLELPSTKNCDFTYKFLTDDKKVAFLRIDRQDGFREIVEYAIYHGFDVNVVKQFAIPIYKRFQNKKAPSSLDSLLAGIPSATEVFRNLVIEMKKYGTESLIIDLSRNHGGQSVLSQILIYFLYGKSQLVDLQKTFLSIDKFSDHYFEVFTQANLDDINKQHSKDHSYKLTKDDYDFNLEWDRNLKLAGIITTDSIKIELHEEFKPYSTFYEEYKSGQYDSYFKSQKVIVVCSERTYSAGFGTLVDLYKCNATVVGIPAGQSANCFGNAIYFKLKNTGINGFVSSKYIEMFPGNLKKGEELIPHFPLTFKILKNYDFDPNTVFLYTLNSILTLK